jgi:hypothetical protein
LFGLWTHQYLFNMVRNIGWINSYFAFADSMSVWIWKVHMAVVLNEYGGTVGVCSCHSRIQPISDQFVWHKYEYMAFVISSRCINCAKYNRRKKRCILKISTWVYVSFNILCYFEIKANKINIEIIPLIRNNFKNIHKLSCTNICLNYCRYMFRYYSLRSYL